jgi:hypothetical protein
LANSNSINLTRRPAHLAFHGDWSFSHCFLQHVSSVSQLLELIGIGYHQFADDIQQYIALNAAIMDLPFAWLTCCMYAIHQLLLKNNLQLNSDKLEVVMMSTAFQLHQAITVMSTVDITGCLQPKLTKLNLICHF